MKSKKMKKLEVQKKVNKPKRKRKNIFKEIFYVDNKFDFIGLIKNILIPLGGGLLVGLITRNSMTVFESLKKSILIHSK